MASAGLVTLLAVGAGLGAYALYRKSEEHSHGMVGRVKTQAVLTGAGAYVDYKDAADARSDRRPQSEYLVKPYQIFNPGGGVRPFEIDAHGQPTGRDLVLPGEPSNPSAVLVGVDHSVVDYQNPADARTDRRSERIYFVRPYQIFNPGGGVRPFEIDAEGQPTGRQLVMPGESPTVGSPAEYVMVGQGAHAVSPTAPDPHNCLCPQDLDPLNATLPTYTCPCNTPNAVHPPYATHGVGAWPHGYGGGGYGGHGFNRNFPGGLRGNFQRQRAQRLRQQQMQAQMQAQMQMQQAQAAAAAAAAATAAAAQAQQEADTADGTDLDA